MNMQVCTIDTYENGFIHACPHFMKTRGKLVMYFFSHPSIYFYPPTHRKKAVKSTFDDRLHPNNWPDCFNAHQSMRIIFLRLPQFTASSFTTTNPHTRTIIIMQRYYLPLYLFFYSSFFSSLYLKYNSCSKTRERYHFTTFVCKWLISLIIKFQSTFLFPFYFLSCHFLLLTSKKFIA